MFISEAWAQAAAAGGGSDFLVQLFPLVLIFVVFYFLLIRPQQAKVKAQREMLAGVKRGDRVVTGGGIIGLVTKVIGDNELQVELAEGVRVRIIKETITDIITRGESVRGAKESRRGRQADAAAAGGGARAQEPAGQPVRRQEVAAKDKCRSMLNLPRWQVIADHRRHGAGGAVRAAQRVAGQPCSTSCRAGTSRAASISASTCAAAPTSCSKPTCARC